MSNASHQSRASFAHERRAELPGLRTETFVSRADFDRARSGHLEELRERVVERPPQLALPQPHPSFAQPSHNAQDMWFAANKMTTLTKEEFMRARTASAECLERKMSKG